MKIYRRTDGQTDRQTESDAYEPTMQIRTGGLKNGAVSVLLGLVCSLMHSWTKFGYGQISIETATHSYMRLCHPCI